MFYGRQPGPDLERGLEGVSAPSGRPGGVKKSLNCSIFGKTAIFTIFDITILHNLQF